MPPVIFSRIPNRAPITGRSSPPGPGSWSISYLTDRFIRIIRPGRAPVKKNPGAPAKPAGSRDLMTERSLPRTENPCGADEGKKGDKYQKEREREMTITRGPAFSPVPGRRPAPGYPGLHDLLLARVGGRTVGTPAVYPLLPPEQEPLCRLHSAPHSSRTRLQPAQWEVLTPCRGFPRLPVSRYGPPACAAGSPAASDCPSWCVFPFAVSFN